MADHLYFKFYQGVYLPKIAWALSKGSGDQKQHVRELHKVFKKYFCVSSTSGFNNHEFLIYLSKIQMIMIREKGIMPPLFNESDDIQDMSLKDFINLQKIINK